jgi:BirA family transcriptional regulator, biotin operon repressor / biotin---[acetyl-CoA-carboxylase] ligase
MGTPSATWRITVVDETGSTNADLLAAAAAGAADRSVLMARHQTAGRGRLDRRWIAPPGSNLLVSLLFRDVPQHPHQLTERVALAAAEACREIAGVSPMLKWPNDLLLDGGKLAGVLAQSGGSGPTHVVVGIGLNVKWAPDDATKLGDQYDPRVVLDAMLAAYDQLPVDITALYRASLATIGQSVRVELAGSAVFGRALDVLPDGRLVVLDDCGITHRFDTGDVVHLR